MLFKNAVLTAVFAAGLMFSGAVYAESDAMTGEDRMAGTQQAAAQSEETASPADIEPAAGAEAAAAGESEEQAVAPKKLPVTTDEARGATY